MAFHVACPITCRKVCYCTLGFPKPLQNASKTFLDDISKLEDFLKHPFLCRVPHGGDTVKVPVPKVTPPPPVIIDDITKIENLDETLSAQTKRIVLQKRAAQASLQAEDFARRVETGAALVDDSKDVVGEDQGNSNIKVMCRLCFVGENEGSTKARKMVPCKSCDKKYHRNCVKAWSQNRDLFHWSSWTCPSCRICEACRRTGDPTKFKFCRRCDGAYHCYCQHPPHKNVSNGPYLCPKHTKCHSCESAVPGNGNSVREQNCDFRTTGHNYKNLVQQEAQSRIKLIKDYNLLSRCCVGYMIRWFLGYTCCDACGRLFVKGNYCPVCLKVYRDSEATPMVCCDVCQRWVHCHCDGISDDKYQQFQADGNLQYKCPTCRGECHQVRDLEDAVQELWRRKNETDRDLIASLRAAAGLPTQEELYNSDDEESARITLRSEFGRSLKVSLKSLADKTPKNKEHEKKSSNTKNTKKKGDDLSIISKSEAHQSFDRGYTGFDGKNDNMQSVGEGKFSSPITGIKSEGVCSINQAGVLKRKLVDEVTTDDHIKKPRTVQIKSSKSHGIGIGDGSSTVNKSTITNTKGAKLTIHFGRRTRNATSPSVNQTAQESRTINGSEDDPQEQMIGRQTLGRRGKLGEAVDSCDQLKGTRSKGKESNNPNSVGGNMADISGSVSPAIRGEKVYTRKNVDARSNVPMGGNNDSTRTPSGSQALNKDSKLSLKLKLKTSNLENQSFWAPKGEGEISAPVKGQRSKRRRPSPILDKASGMEDGKAFPRFGENEKVDANWVLQKSGKDAIGKRVEVHQPSSDTWHKGMVEDIEGTSLITIALDDGTTKHYELGKQGIRFVSQKQKRSANRG